jgi:hypothetical protein
MATIEERAEKWARKRVDEVAAYKDIEFMMLTLQAMAEALTEAYLAGSAQTQADHTRSGPLTVRFHSDDGCPGHIVSEQSCPRLSTPS